MVRSLLVVLLIAAVTSPAHAANARAMRTLRHFAALQYRQCYGTPAPVYHGTPTLPGAYQFVGLGGRPISPREVNQRRLQDFRNWRAVSALTN